MGKGGRGAGGGGGGNGCMNGNSKRAKRGAGEKGGVGVESSLGSPQEESHSQLLHTRSKQRSPKHKLKAGS